MAFVPGDDAVDNDKELDEMEKAVLESAAHARDAQAQRMWVREIEAAAVTTNKCEDMPHGERMHLFHFNCAQNIQCSQFGSEWPGETHHHSPLSVNAIGVVIGDTTKTLHAHCHHKDNGAKGGENVATVPHHRLKQQNLLVGGAITFVLFATILPDKVKQDGDAICCFVM